MLKGKIIRALSGFYDVQLDDRIIRCKGRGLFRKKQVTPLVGDIVELDLDSPQASTGMIQHVLERTNELVRPPVANIDHALIVQSITEPELNPILLDRFLVLAESKRIEPVILFTKKDLASSKISEHANYYKDAYEKIGYQVIETSTEPDLLVQSLESIVKNRVCVIAGQSGVGKSTLLNRIEPDLNIETADISKSLGRGKHTTRHVELYQLLGGFIVDTPGFSSLDFAELTLEELRETFIEFERISEHCKFRGCFHINEPKCAVKDALETGEIESFRYKHYQLFHEEIKNRKPRY
ncbi:ribosome small subunit-dependent GTPase A [Halalkalibacillus halophilus]|uniref:ribosome small subunit-dependent GTPase A n=1 Tax=Halalkalibacillus halophilus TaxID=392827 RepID=UPI0003FAC9E7|nr:ribosome small subunit-dependent GTPase A [Halalkalibacillus halophilus]